ncbi:hypothetical protein IWX50DRAFT_22765 [Phyllosticta citricarpa]|uniref:Secreted protein n=1 Tax=Phyllosticta citricarpa TaxID=55181 RepID=A0ABR1LLU9_9PEZI
MDFFPLFFLFFLFFFFFFASSCFAASSGHAESGKAGRSEPQPMYHLRFFPFSFFFSPFPKKHGHASVAVPFPNTHSNTIHMSLLILSTTNVSGLFHPCLVDMGNQSQRQLPPEDKVD